VKIDPTPAANECLRACPTLAETLQRDHSPSTWRVDLQTLQGLRWLLFHKGGRPPIFIWTEDLHNVAKVQLLIRALASDCAEG